MALGTMQIMSLVLPLITLPYLTRVLGVNAFGQVAFTQIIFQYFIMITDWGFSWSATKEIALVKHDPEKLSVLFLKTWLAQLLLLLILFILKLLLTICLSLVIMFLMSLKVLIYLLIYKSLIVLTPVPNFTSASSRFSRAYVAAVLYLALAFCFAELNLSVIFVFKFLIRFSSDSYAVDL